MAQAEASQQRTTLLRACLLFLLSGTSALLLEVVWTRLLVLHFGGTTLAMTAVLATFMTGLGLGSTIAGRMKDPAKPLQFYGLLELGIAVSALLVPAILLLFKGFLHSAYGTNGPTAGFEILRFVIAFLVLIIPTTLMGASLPVLGKFVSRSSATVARRLGLVYACNTAGAALGTLLAGFVLIGSVGMSATVAIAATLNLTCAVSAIVWGKKMAPQEDTAVDEDEEEPEEQPEGKDSILGLVMLSAGLSGFVCVSLEILWTKILINCFQSTVQAISLVLLIFLIGLSGGTAIGARLAKSGRGLGALGLVQAIQALAIAAALWKMEDAQNLYLSLTDHLPVVPARMVLSAILLLVPCLLLGITFPLCLYIVRNRYRDPLVLVGRTYAINSFGCALGPLAATFLLMPTLGVFRSIAVLALLLALVGLATLFIGKVAAAKPVFFAVPIAAAGICLVFLVMLASGPSRYLLPLDPLTSGDKILVYKESQNGVALVSQSNKTGEKKLFLNGCPAAGNGLGTEYMRMMGHLPMLTTGNRKAALVICLGTGTTLGSVSMHNPDVLDCAELDPDVPECARQFADNNHHVLDNQKLHLILDDGRNFLNQTDRMYDVVTLEPMPPTNAGSVNLYSKEFNALVKKHLNPGGVFAQWLPFHLVTVEDTHRILSAVASEFSHVIIWFMPQDLTGIILASDGPIGFGRTDLPDPVVQDLSALGFKPDKELWKNMLLSSPDVHKLAETSRPVSDDWPVLEYSDLEQLQERTGPRKLTYQVIQDVLSFRADRAQASGQSR